MGRPVGFLDPQVRGGARLDVGDRRGREASPIPRLPLVKLPTKTAKDSDEDVCRAAGGRCLPLATQAVELLLAELDALACRARGGPEVAAQAAELLP